MKFKCELCGKEIDKYHDESIKNHLCEKNRGKKIPRERMIEHAENLDDNLKPALKIRNAETRGWNAAINKIKENLYGHEIKCQHKFSVPVPGAIGMCDYCGIDEATAKEPVIVKEDINEKNVRLLADMHINNLQEIKYRHNRAIEYAMYKTGKTWESNRTRLSFYEYFEESLRKEPKELGGNQ